MKKVNILFFLFVIHQLSFCQHVIKTSTPCTDDVLFTTPGRWLKAYNGLLDYSENLHLTSAQKKEVLNRLDAIHQMMLEICPQPIAFDAVWHHSISHGTFAEQVKYEPNSQGVLNRVALEEKPVASFSYTSGFFRHYCNPNNSSEVWSGYPGETGTWIDIYANDLQQAGMRTFYGGEGEPLTINGYPIFQLCPLIKKFGDFELIGIDSETAYLSTTGITKLVIIHRKGMLPYIPVTRKQYLERCIPYFTNWYDKIIKRLKETPLPFDDKDNRDIRDNQINISIKNKDACLKKYQDELEKTTNEGLMEAPAIVQFFCSLLMNDEKIFVDEKEGMLLVTENPEYMRKELPKYVPQFFVVKWKWNEWPPQADIAKLIEERFPFDKLQAMIDK